LISILIILSCLDSEFLIKRIFIKTYLYLMNVISTLPAVIQTIQVEFLGLNTVFSYFKELFHSGQIIKTMTGISSALL